MMDRQITDNPNLASTCKNYPKICTALGNGQSNNSVAQKINGLPDFRLSFITVLLNVDNPACQNNAGNNCTLFIKTHLPYIPLENNCPIDRPCMPSMQWNV